MYAGCDIFIVKRGHFTKFCPLEGPPKVHIVPFSPPEGHPRGHFITFCDPGSNSA